MSQVMDEEIKHWTARRESALVLEIIQGRTTPAEAARQFDLTPAEVEDWGDQGKAGNPPCPYSSSAPLVSRLGIFIKPML